MYRNFREEAESAQLQGALGAMVDKRMKVHEGSIPKITSHSSGKRSGAIEKKNENLLAWMLDCLKASEYQTHDDDRMTLRARPTCNTTRHRSIEARERRRGRYLSRKAKGRDTVTVLIKGGSL